MRYMAEFDVDLSSMDSLIRSLEGLDLFDEDMQGKMLGAGADHLIATIRDEATRSDYQLKRISSKISKGRKIRRDKNGNYYMTVTVSGKNERGERNATVAFVLNYGRSEKYGRISGSYYWTRAVNRTEKTVQGVYEDIVTEELKERGLV